MYLVLVYLSCPLSCLGAATFPVLLTPLSCLRADTFPVRLTPRSCLGAGTFPVRLTLSFRSPVLSDNSVSFPLGVLSIAEGTGLTVLE